ncbi:MAG TPA: citrate synthase [Thermoanaerobaculaceae bacterium]|nr:citrate synthase [Thermoanaerobaculaceae bacterium]
MSKDSVTITDNRTGQSYELPIEHGTIRALDLRQIKAADDDFGLMTYDPGYMNTASCRSRITFIDGDKGILEYRGYPIDELAEHSSYLEVAYLLWTGELPARDELERWSHGVRYHTMIHESIKKFLDGFRHDAHPMGILVSTVAALATFYPESKNIQDPETRRIQFYRLISKMPTLAAFAYRHSIGMPYVYPDNNLGYAENFLNMMFHGREPVGSLNPNSHHSPVLARALDVLFILHADHEQNCSTSSMRMVSSAFTDPYTSVAAAAAALYGPLHGGANEAVLRMLREIGDIKHIPEFIAAVKRGERKLMGFGHRVYKSYDPRAKVIKYWADRVFEVTGRNPLIDIALELEKIALADDYFISRKLYPNVDFYSGIIYEAMGFPTDMFPVLFAIPRTAGWLTQWRESLEDPDQKIARPRQIYLGAGRRPFVPVDQRPSSAQVNGIV